MRNETKFSDCARQALELAHQAAAQLGHSYVGSEHLLLGLCREDGAAARCLKACGFDAERVGQLVEGYVGRGSACVRPAQGLTLRARRVIELAAVEASRLGQPELGSEHLLLGILREGSCAALRLLVENGLDGSLLFTRLLEHLGNTPPDPEGRSPVAPQSPPRSAGRRSDTRTLDQYSRDLTDAAQRGALDPVIGRDSETRRVIQILCRRSKNNPLLLGEPGVGKTAIVEGLAQRIAEGAVPEPLRGKRLVALDLSGMVAGTKYRGDFEERIKTVLEETRSAKNVILFLDELHTVIGAGAAEGAIDAANILKPALSRGEIQLVGATTRSEYRRHIEKDAALERRFQPVTVGEPEPEAAVRILLGLRPRYEAHHRLYISDEAIRAAVTLSGRYLPDRCLPDKAIDLIDEAAARLRLCSLTPPAELSTLEAQWESIRREKDEAAGQQQFEQAASLRDREQKLHGQLEQLRQRWEQRSEGTSRVCAEDIAAVVADWTGIPVTTITEDESARLLRLEESLRRRVIGQDEAVSAAARAIRRGRTGLKHPHRPIGSFLFLGPTGVGKTELCRALAEQLFGSEDALIKLDMSEFAEQASVSKLIGAAPGYVGYEEGGRLTEQVRRKPYSVILFDELEKAHGDLFNLLLQILEDGVLTDSQGRRASFCHSVIVMTSNVGAQTLTERQQPLGFLPSAEALPRERVFAELRQTFRPELLNRMDDILLFRQLGKPELLQIAAAMVRDVSLRLAGLGYSLQVDEAVLDRLAQTGYDPRYGARPLRRALQTALEDPAAELLLGGLTPGSRLEARVEDGEIRLFSCAPVENPV